MSYLSHSLELLMLVQQRRSDRNIDPHGRSAFPDAGDRKLQTMITLFLNTEVNVSQVRFSVGSCTSYNWSANDLYMLEGALALLLPQIGHAYYIRVVR